MIKLRAWMQVPRKGNFDKLDRAWGDTLPIFVKREETYTYDEYKIIRVEICEVKRGKK